MTTVRPDLEIVESGPNNVMRGQRTIKRTGVGGESERNDGKF